MFNKVTLLSEASRTNWTEEFKFSCVLCEVMPQCVDGGKHTTTVEATMSTFCSHYTVYICFRPLSFTDHSSTSQLKSRNLKQQMSYVVGTLLSNRSSIHKMFQITQAPWRVKNFKDFYTTNVQFILIYMCMKKEKGPVLCFNRKNLIYLHAN